MATHENIPASGITPPEVYFNRRALLRGGVIAAGMAATGLLYRKINGADLTTTDTAELLGLTRPQAPGYRVTDEQMTSVASVTNYNNFYESTTNKDGVAAAAKGFKTAGWKIEVGGLCHKPKTFDLDDLRRIAPPEERVYRKVSAPAGKFVFGGHEAKRIVMLAGGVGITPMMAIVRSLTDRCWDGELYLLFAVRKRNDIIFESELAYLEKRFANLHVHITLSDDPDAVWEGRRGRISRELIDAVVPDLKRGPVMMCGPDPMMKAMRKLLVEQMKLPDAEVLEEAFVSPPAPAEGSAAVEDAIAAAEAVAAAEPPANGAAANVTFRRTGKSAELAPEQTLLEAAEDCGIAIPFECRSGICGQCKTKLVSGRVTMEVQDALTSGDRAKGLVLACQARAMQDLVVDA